MRNGLSSAVRTRVMNVSRVLALLRRATVRVLFVTLGLGVIAHASSHAASALHTSSKAAVLVCGGSMMNGDHFADSVLAAMREHYAGCRTVALVLHASHPADRDRMEERLRTAFGAVGVPGAESLHRHSETDAAALLRRADGIFVGGGETFVLLRELTRNGQLQLIRKRVLEGVPYGGSSAGANIAGLVIGTTNDFPVTDIPSRDALALIPATINPHHPPPEQKADFEGRAGKIKIYLRFNPVDTVLALGNASIVVWRDERAKLVTGRGWIYQAGGMRELTPGADVPELAPNR